MNNRTIEIPLPQGYVTIVDEEDADLGKLQVYVGKTSGPYPTKTVMTPEGKRPVRIHRIIMGRILGHSLERGQAVDHIDGNGLNNCRSNLRLANKRENATNAKLRKDNKSGMKGVCWSIPGNRWRAYGKLNGKQVHLGYFDTVEEAHQAYRRFAEENYGEFARFE